MKHLVLAGAGHAHLETLQNIRTFVDDGIRVSVIGPAEYHYYSGMGPGMLGGSYTPSQIRFAVKQQVEEQGGNFLLDKVVGLNPLENQIVLESGESLQYDLLSCNTGSSIQLPPVTASKHVYPVKPIEGLAAAKSAIESLAAARSIRVAVIGGGPAGVEIAGNVAHLLAAAGSSSQIHLYAGRRLLAGFAPFVQKKSRQILENNTVIIHEGGHLQSIRENILCFDDDNEEQADCIIVCTGVHPDSFFKKSGLPVGKDGGLLVNANLQCVEYSNIFGGGDCISFAPDSLAKVGVYAVRENPVLLHNLRAFFKGTPLQAFDPGGEYLLIFNLGEGKGVLRKRWIQFSGQFAFQIKDYIDSKFMKRFQ